MESSSQKSANDVPMVELRTLQAAWSEKSIAERIGVLKRCRHLIAKNADQLTQAIQLPQRRDRAESLAAEVFPMADAIKFLERHAANLLRPQKTSRRDRPAWGPGLQVTNFREPFGVVLVIGTWNYPLFLTGTQMIQGIVAGNAMVIKPGVHGGPVMKVLIDLLQDSGMPRGLVHLASEDTIAAQNAIQAGADKVFFTGSAQTGKRVLEQLSQHATPSVMELSGSDAVFVLPGADLERVVRCLAFGMQINSGATCIAPRRVFGPSKAIDFLKDRLVTKFANASPVPVYPPAGQFATRLICDTPQGIHRLLPQEWPELPATEFPLTILEVDDAAHPVMQNDIFAPVISLVAEDDPATALRQDAQCPYALGASVFGPPAEAREFARRVNARMCRDQ